MKKLGEILGRDWRLLLDDPDSAPEGISPALWEGADQDAKVWANLLVHEAPHLTVTQRKIILDLVKDFRK
jgi:hypothetical protein